MHTGPVPDMQTTQHAVSSVVYAFMAGWMRRSRDL